MQSLRRLIPEASSSRAASILGAQLSSHQKKLFELPSQHLAQRSSNRFLDIYKISADEMNRGYFADLSELKQHGGKVWKQHYILQWAQRSYSSGGVLENLSHSVVAVHTVNGSHCLDLHRAKQSDPEWLVRQRKVEVKIIKGWITKYYTDLLAFKK